MRIVCLGDSLTAGYNIRPEEGWVSLLDKEDKNEWINRGVCGDTTSGMLARLGLIIPADRPDMMILMGGDNDLLTGGDTRQARVNMTALVQQCVHAGVKPVVGIPFPVRHIPREWQALSGKTMEQISEMSDAYTAWLRCYVKTFMLRSIDFSGMPGEEREGGYFQPDGLHPNAAGNRRMADAVKEWLKKHGI